MRKVFVFIWERIREVGLALAFMAVIVVGVLAVVVGFRSCWQCQKFSHLNYMRLYWTWHDTKKPVDVCEKCYQVLRESDEEGFI